MLLFLITIFPQLQRKAAETEARLNDLPSARSPAPMASTISRDVIIQSHWAAKRSRLDDEGVDFNMSQLRMMSGFDIDNYLGRPYHVNKGVVISKAVSSYFDYSNVPAKELLSRTFEPALSVV